ncbi:MAG TPA: DHA2 family efflux MFS transporter permease subunit [Rhizomicrobium sp.]|nr:DHA2 family efflux MFS transporter permease subunit [Rhizomicrobium sp.]
MSAAGHSSARLASGPQAPLAGAALAVTVFALAMGTFMQVLDATIANVSLPTIAGNLGASTDQSTWIITSFVVANGICVPVTGWLMGRYGAVRVFVLSILGFTITSLLCGVAWSLESLVFFRTLQGAVSGPIIPGSQALMLSIFPHHRRTTALAIWSATTLVAPICGPLLGGYISDSWHWGWIFLINVPVGLIVAALCWGNLQGRESATRKLPIDSIGLALLVVWAGALQVMLDTGKNEDWFESTQIIVLGLASLIGFGAFLLWEWAQEHPIIDLSLFRNRNFTLGTVVFCLGNGVFMANMLLIPLWLQTQLGYTATWAGLVSAPTGAVAISVTPLAARLMSRFDARWIATIAFTASTISYWMRTPLTAEASFMDIALPLMVQGISVGTFFIATITILLDGVPPEKIPAASGLSNFARIIAASFSVSLLTTFWDRRAALHQSHMADLTSGFTPALNNMLLSLQNLGFSDLGAKAAVVRGMTGQAYLLASLDVFIFSAWACLVAIVIVWLCRRCKPHGPATLTEPLIDP